MVVSVESLRHSQDSRCRWTAEETHGTHLSHTYAAIGRSGRSPVRQGNERAKSEVTAVEDESAHPAVGGRAQVVALKVGGSSPLGHPK